MKDYDVFYFDEDLSFEAENKIINSAQKLFQDLDINIELKNQARVHLWYSSRFGGQYPKLESTQDGIDRYLISGTCLGLDIESHKIYAPNGFSDTEQGILRINPKNYKLDLFHQKAKSYQARWPWLKIIEPNSQAV
ncbi:nucleotidyltransferase family protein [Acinetobacter bouvetii]|uniref:nucleotidyltransferase family protein n=1 Tax=Acinetobacter bouvetii TaxID=202951 RepID=UPI0034E2A4BC